MILRVGKKWEPPRKRATLEWLREEYRLPSEGAALPGPYNPDYVPYLWGIFAALDDIKTRIVVTMKAAQIGWTFGLIGWVGKKIDVEPCPMVILFPKDGAAREFSDEKLTPAIKATPALSSKIDVSTSRKSGNRSLFKNFPGGFAKLAGSNSISNVQSTPARIVVIEEPDQTCDNVKDQGDAIRLVKERQKRFRDGLLVLGGTPSVKGVSRVEEHIELSDQRVLPIACNDCGEKHVLDFENVTWVTSDEGQAHPVYGHAKPDSSVYACPHCGSVWDDYQRQQNIINTVKQSALDKDPMFGWVPTVEVSGGIIGFKELNELYVCIPGTSLADVVRDYLEALHDAEKGDQSGLIVFQNSKLGRPYEYQSNAPAMDELADRAEDYEELTIPEGGLVLTAGVDVQHDRLAIIIDAYGRDEESWTSYCGEIAAKSSTVDIKDPVWDELDKLLFTPRKHVKGFTINMSAVSIDSSDGQTSDAVYHYVRTRQRHGVMAVKGSSNDYGNREIYSAPRKVDFKTKTKASKYGLQVYIVGTYKAKDLLIGDHGRITLLGSGAGRMHWYQDIRADFYEQITSEIKAPHRSVRGKMVWQKKSGVRNEFLDCKSMSLHAARSIKLHAQSPAWWQNLEQKLIQADMFSQTDEKTEAKENQKQNSRKRKRGGFVNNW